MPHKQVSASRVTRAQHKYTRYFVEAEHGTTIEQLSHPQYFTHCIAIGLRPTDRLEVHEESGAWIVELLVVSVGQNSVETEVLFTHDFLAKGKLIGQPTADEKDYFVAWGGPGHKWRVMRADEVVHYGLQSRMQANEWLAAHLKARTAA